MCVYARAFRMYTAGESEEDVKIADIILTVGCQ